MSRGLGDVYKRQTPTLTNRSDIYLAIDMSQSGQKVITIDKDGDWSSTTNDVYTLTVKW